MQPDQPEYADETERMQSEADAQAEAAYERGLAEGRRQATEGWERHWGVRFEDVDDVQRFATEASARQLAGASDTVMARLVGPWEPAEQQPEHAFDESSVVNPATGEPYRGSSGPEPYEPPDPLCVCGASWLGDEGCLTQQPGWTPPPPYDGPNLEELLPGKEPGCPTCSGPVRETVGMICQTCGTDYASGGVVEPSPLTAEEAEPARCTNLPGCPLHPGVTYEVHEVDGREIRGPRLEAPPTRPRMTDGCGPEHTFTGSCELEDWGARD